MTYYLIAEANVRDKEGFNQKFAAVGMHLCKECHGEYLARGYENAICVRGVPPESNVMLARFPDLDCLNDYLKKLDPLIEKIGKKCADFRIVAIEGLLVNMAGRQTT